MLTDNGTQFVDSTPTAGWEAALPADHEPAGWRWHPFDCACEQLKIEHRLTKPYHPWTNGRVERMNRTIKDATVRRYYYDAHEELRRAAWGSEDPIGARIAMPVGDSAPVVGDAGDVRTTGLDGEAGRIVYVAAAQGGYNFMTVLVKSRSDPRALVPAVRRVVRALDAGVPLHHVRALDELLAALVPAHRATRVDPMRALRADWPRGRPRRPIPCAEGQPREVRNSRRPGEALRRLTFG